MNIMKGPKIRNTSVKCYLPPFIEMLKCLNNLQLNGERSLFATYRHSVLLILNGEVVAHVGKTFHFPRHAEAED